MAISSRETLGTLRFLRDAWAYTASVGSVVDLPNEILEERGPDVLDVEDSASLEVLRDMLCLKPVSLRAHALKIVVVRDSFKLSASDVLVEPHGWMQAYRDAHGSLEFVVDAEPYQVHFDEGMCWQTLVFSWGALSMPELQGLLHWRLKTDSLTIMLNPKSPPCDVVPINVAPYIPDLLRRLTDEEELIINTGADEPDALQWLAGADLINQVAESPQFSVWKLSDLGVMMIQLGDTAHSPRYLADIRLSTTCSAGFQPSTALLLEGEPREVRNEMNHTDGAKITDEGKLWTCVLLHKKSEK